MLARLGAARQTDRDAQIPPGAVKLVLLVGVQCTVSKVHWATTADRMVASDHAIGARWVRVEHVVQESYHSIALEMSDDE